MSRNRSSNRLNLVHRKKKWTLSVCIQHPSKTKYFRNQKACYCTGIRLPLRAILHEIKSRQSEIVQLGMQQRTTVYLDMARFVATEVNHRIKHAFFSCNFTQFVSTLVKPISIALYKVHPGLYSKRRVPVPRPSMQNGDVVSLELKSGHRFTPKHAISSQDKYFLPVLCHARRNQTQAHGEQEQRIHDRHHVIVKQNRTTCVACVLDICVNRQRMLSHNFPCHKFDTSQHHRQKC